jgi:hypothetical protein
MHRLMLPIVGLVVFLFAVSLDNVDPRRAGEPLPSGTCSLDPNGGCGG